MATILIETDLDVVSIQLTYKPEISFDELEALESE